MEKTLKIGTRDSQLAVWQAEQVRKKLQEKGINSELVYIKSDGDIDLVTPLYEMGVQGVFTRALDAALLSGKIDLAVHSLKDVPTQPAEGLCLSAVLPRGNHIDILVTKEPSFRLPGEGTESRLTIATSSIRRRAQWLNRYPEHRMENLRGNINTRLRKLEESQWDGAVFAAAGQERLNLRRANVIELDWMLPAPAQGAICIVSRSEDEDIKEICRTVNDPATELCTSIERDFLRELMGGCATPIAAFAAIRNDKVHFTGKLLSLNGDKCLEVRNCVPADQARESGKEAALKIIRSGGNEIIREIRNG